MDEFFQQSCSSNMLFGEHSGKLFVHGKKETNGKLEVLYGRVMNMRAKDENCRQYQQYSKEQFANRYP